MNCIISATPSSTQMPSYSARPRELCDSTLDLDLEMKEQSSRMRTDNNVLA
jgi:hypothetical protein